MVCEPYFSGSHRSWAEGIAAHSRHDVDLVTHAGGFWKWRMHGSAVTLARAIADVVAARGRPDVVLASDMVNLAALAGLCRDALPGTAFVLYMHENQLTYPLPAGGVADEGYAMANWVSMCAADAVVFNSDHHRRELFGALPGFLRRFPDHRHGALIEAVAAKSAVLPVGVEEGLFDLRRPALDAASTEPPVVLWNHRWEYDKDPAGFFDALEALAGEGVAFRVAIAGEQFQAIPTEFERAQERLAGRIIHFGTAAPDEYRRLLARADVVASTARHEFFGVAVVEAVAAGALPVLPDRLSYPELVPDDLRGRWLYRDGDPPTAHLRRALADHDRRRADAAAAQAYVRRFAWPNVIAGYDDLLGATAGKSRR